MGAPQAYWLHGHGLTLACDDARLQQSADTLLAPFAERALPESFRRVEGVVRPLDPARWHARPSPEASRIAVADDLAEVYVDGPRLWLFDDRWGAVEVDLPRARFSAWTLPILRCSPLAALERAVLWPMARLLERRGSWLLRSAAIELHGRGVLIVSIFDAAAELVALLDAGARVVGQRWTAVGAETPPRARGLPGPSLTPRGWEDLTQGLPCLRREEVECADLVLIDQPRGRRCDAARLTPTDAARLLARITAGIDPGSRSPAATLCRQVNCWRARLSDRAEEARRLAPFSAGPSPTLWIAPGLRRVAAKAGRPGLARAS